MGNFVCMGVLDELLLEPPELLLLDPELPLLDPLPDEAFRYLRACIALARICAIRVYVLVVTTVYCDLKIVSRDLLSGLILNFIRAGLFLS